MSAQKTILTGDRPTGPLHLGHYVGSLLNRVELQKSYKQFVMLADIQALTDNVDNPQKIRTNVCEVVLDYLAVGIDPSKTTIFLQSMIPEIAELATLYLNFVTLSRLKRNPTVKTEIQQKGYGDAVTVGFLTYPVHQAADITIFKGNLVPVGEDQLPMIEQTNEIVRAFNRTYNTNVLVEAEALIPRFARLPGIDGKAKMGKSLGNAIFLSDSADVLSKKVMQMYTDPDHVRVEDPGKIEGNTVFTYLDVFGTDIITIAQMKEQYQKGGLGDVKVKRYLAEVLNTLLEPLRQRRAEYAKDPQAVMQIIRTGTEHAREVAAHTMMEVRQAIGLNYW
ncbi:tryptophan--tRNA ligase [Candidatus Dependentiae bacterium]|nr:tryptophan--tRNA ligase [Candidatus Dependentiae bacterium]MCC7414745.1 tryptophan--tRNA ligase [Campylobacterota bacterium]